MRTIVAVWVGLVLVGVVVGLAQERAYMVREVQILGNKALTKREIYDALPFNIGSRITLEDIEKGAEALRALGTLEKVEADYRILQNGIRVIYRVVENPIVKRIEFTGNESYQFYLIDLWGIRLFPYKMKLARRDELIDALRDAKVEENKPLNYRWFDDKIIEKTITQFYLKKGYTFIGVDAVFNREKQTLTIQIVEGKLDAVEVRGLDEVPQSEIAYLLRLPVGEPVKLAPIQEALKMLNRSIYFSQSDEHTIGVEPGNKPNSLKIVWNLKERRLLQTPTEIRQIRLTGATVYPLGQLQALIGRLPQGRPVTNFELLTALKRVYDLYRVEGYLLVNFVQESLEDGVLTVRITEGKITKVTISNSCKGGLKSVIIPNVIEFPRQCTSELVIRKALRLTEGDLVNENPLRDSFRNLLQLGYFKQDGVTVQPKIVDESTGEVELQVSVVEEDQLGNVKGGISYNPQTGLVGQISLGWKNILGTAQDVDLSLDRGLVGKEVLNYSFTYKTTAYFKEYNSVEVSLFNNTQQQTDPQPHAMTKAGATFAVSYPVLSDLTLTLRLRYEDVWKAQPINEKSLIMSVGIDLVRDTRNNPIFPTSGGEWIVMGEQAGKFAVGTEFTKLQGIWTHHLRTFERQTLSVRLYGAFGLSLPAQERFSFGGVMTVRGWGTQLTHRFALANLEYRMELAENIWGVWYYDAGWAEGVGWRQSLGFEMRLVTGFIGNVRFVLAWPFFETGLQIAPVFQFGFGTMF